MRGSSASRNIWTGTAQTYGAIFPGAFFVRDVQESWRAYGRFLSTLAERWEAQAMDFILHLAVSLLATLLGCVIAKVFFRFGRGTLYPFAALLLSLVLVSGAAYVLIVLVNGV